MQPWPGSSRALPRPPAAGRPSRRPAGRWPRTTTLTLWAARSLARLRRPGPPRESQELPGDVELPCFSMRDPYASLLPPGLEEGSYIYNIS